MPGPSWNGSFAEYMRTLQCPSVPTPPAESVAAAGAPPTSEATLATLSDEQVSEAFCWLLTRAVACEYEDNGA